MRLIDVDELKKALKRNCTPELCHDYNTDWCEKVCPHNHFEDLIDNAPTVEQRPHGKWNDKKVAFYLECSNCGALVSDYQPNIFLENEKLNYCPNCGANMRGDKDV